MASSSLMCEAGHTKLGATQRDEVRREMEEGVQDGRTHVHLWLIHVDV